MIWTSLVSILPEVNLRLLVICALVCWGESKGQKEIFSLEYGPQLLSCSVLTAQASSPTDQPPALKERLQNSPLLVDFWLRSKS